MRRSLLGLWLVLPLQISGCINFGDDDTDFLSPTPQVIGSGNIVSESRTVPPFHSIETRIHADVSFTEHMTQSVRVDADDNLIQDVTTSVEGGVLIIGANVSYSSQNVTVTLEMTDVRDVRQAGVGDVHGSDISSTGDVSVRLGGVGSVTLSGATDRLHATLSGLGDIDAEGLQSRVSTVTISGTGDCRTTVTEELTATISGFGNVYYAGNPLEVHPTITGTGSIIPI